MGIGPKYFPHQFKFIRARKPCWYANLKLYFFQLVSGKKKRWRYGFWTQITKTLIQVLFPLMYIGQYRKLPIIAHFQFL